MGLDTEKIHRLKAKSFDQLYTKHKAKWDELVKSTANYAKASMKGVGDKPRREDIAAILHNTVKVDPDFELHMETRKLNQKYWSLWFSDYVVEQVYPSPDIQ
jgi:hypothetical protein